MSLSEAAPAAISTASSHAETGNAPRRDDAVPPRTLAYVLLWFPLSSARWVQSCSPRMHIMSLLKPCLSTTFGIRFRFLTIVLMALLDLPLVSQSRLSVHGRNNP